MQIVALDKRKIFLNVNVAQFPRVTKIFTFSRRNPVCTQQNETGDLHVKNECQLEENPETPDHLSEAPPSSCEVSPAFVQGGTTLLLQL